MGEAIWFKVKRLLPIVSKVLMDLELPMSQRLQYFHAIENFRTNKSHHVWEKIYSTAINILWHKRIIFRYPSFVNQNRMKKKNAKSSVSQIDKGDFLRRIICLVLENYRSLQYATYFIIEKYLKIIETTFAISWYPLSGLASDWIFSKKGRLEIDYCV